MSEPRWLDDDEAAAWRGYRRMRGLLDAQLARDLAGETGLSEPDYDVLSTLSETVGHRTRFTELATRLLWSRSRLSHHISRMQQRGLVRREDCPSDARGAFVILTDDGRRAIEAAAPSHVASVRRHFIDRLPPEQLAALTELCATVVDHLTRPGRG